MHTNVSEKEDEKQVVLIGLVLFLESVACMKIKLMAQEHDNTINSNASCSSLYILNIHKWWTVVFLSLTQVHNIRDL